MTKNTAYYKAAFVKSEAASPYAKMNPHTKMKDGTHMMAHHGDTSMKTHDPTHMAKHPGHMKKMTDKNPVPPGESSVGQKKTIVASGKKKVAPHTKMAGKTHMKGTMEEHAMHHRAEHKKKKKPNIKRYLTVPGEQEEENEIYMQTRS